MPVTFGALQKLTAVALLFANNSGVQLSQWRVNKLEAVLLHGTKPQNCLTRPSMHCLYTSILFLAILAKCLMSSRPWKVAQMTKTTGQARETMELTQKMARAGETMAQAQKTMA